MPPTTRILLSDLIGSALAGKPIHQLRCRYTVQVPFPGSCDSKFHGELCSDEIGRGVGTLDAPSMGAVKNASCPIQWRSEIVAVSLISEPRIQGHAHWQGTDLTPIVVSKVLLSGNGRGRRLDRICECRRETVASRRKDVAAVRFHNRADDPVMIG
jgi:hypothetical protein